MKSSYEKSKHGNIAHTCDNICHFITYFFKRQFCKGVISFHFLATIYQLKKGCFGIKFGNFQHILIRLPTPGKKKFTKVILNLEYNLVIFNNTCLVT